MSLVPVTQPKRAPMRVEWLHPSQLFIDRTVLVNSRMPEDRKPHLERVAKKFSWNKFKVPTVVSRGTDAATGLEKFAILNGAGSHYMVTELLPEFKDWLIPCHIVDSSVKTRAQESDVFLAERDTKRLGSLNFYVGELIAKNPEAIGIRNMLTEIGFASPSDRSTKPVPSWPNGFDSIPLARALYREGDLARTLLICRQVWNDEPPGPAITAVGIILKAYPHLDEARLRKVLKENPPKALMENLVLERGKMHIYSRAAALAHSYVTAYDHEFRGRILGGTRANSRYTPSARNELVDAANTLISTWKLAQRPANPKKSVAA